MTAIKMAYNWQKHIKNPKTNEDFVRYIVNTNTNTIFKFDINPHYKSSFDCQSDNEIQTKIQKRKRQYVRVRHQTIIGSKPDGNLDYNKTVPCSRVNKWIKQGYAKECKTYNKALYIQAILRMDKSLGETSEKWRKFAEDLQNKYPEELI